MDTNVALWSLASPERLSAKVRKLLEDPNNKISFSSISIVELELKRARLLSEYDELATEFAQALVSQGFVSIPFTASDATGLSAVYPNRDPFDRMLSTQAIARNVILVTADRDLLGYQPLQTVW